MKGDDIYGYIDFYSSVFLNNHYWNYSIKKRLAQANPTLVDKPKRFISI